MTDYTPLSRFRKFISRVSSLAVEFGNQLQLRGFKTGGSSGQVPRKSSGTDFAWSWANLQWNDVVNKPTTFAPSAHTHPISQVINLQTSLDTISLRALITDTTLVVPTYADNAAAVSGGLAVNRVYKTATGELRIVV